MRINHSCSILIVLLLIAAIASCKSSLEPVYSPEELRGVLREAGGWVPLVIPDSKYRAGSIIIVSATDGQPRWIDHLDGCINVDDFEKFLETGAIPRVEFSKDVSLDADLLLNYRGTSAGPNFESVKKVRLSVDDHSAVAMRLIKFRSWFKNLDDEDYIKKIDPCLDALEEPNTYLVNEAFVINRATYRLYTGTGAEIEVKATELGKFLKFEPKFAYAVSSGGSLAVDEPVVIAVRKVVRVDGGFQVLAAPGGAKTESADALLDKWYTTSMD